MPSSDDVYGEIRSSYRFDQFVEELAAHFHEDGYKNKRLPEIQASFAEQAQEAGLPEEEAQEVAEKAKGALMRQASQQAPPKPESKRDDLEPADDPLPKEHFDEVPGPLYEVLRHIEEETAPFRKAHRLIDAIEWAVKWHTVLVLSDLLREAEVPDEIKVLLAHGLQTPSLGTWNHFFRDAKSALQDPAASWDEWERLEDLENKHGLVHFRNRYAHGATPGDEECQRDVDRFYPLLLRLIGSPLFTEVNLLVAGDSGALRLAGPERVSDVLDLAPGHAAARLPSGDVLDLWPLGVSAEADEESSPAFFFFNALKGKKVEQLNYEIPFQRRDEQLYDAFHEHLPLRAWRQADHPDLDRFRQRVAALTESFKGRREERARLRRFCRAGDGTLMVWGAPGIGKSALLAQVFKEIRGRVSAGGEKLEDDFPPVIEYFIRRSEGRDDPVRFLRYLCNQLDRLFDLSGHGLGDETVKLQEQLEARLQAIEEGDETPRRVVLFVDGLDEAPEIGRYVPAARPWLAVLCAGRDVPDIQDFYDRRDRETRQAVTVGPLDQADVRALLYEVVNKYDPAFDEDYVEAVVDRSEGNPLYLKLLSEELFAGDLEVGDSAALPERMDELYARTVQRVTDGGRAEDALAVLHLLAEAQAALSVPAVAELLDVNAARAQAAVDRAMELLYENPETPEADDYQLFHESLREWLRDEHERACREQAQQLANRCFAWNALETPDARRYALAHTAAHLRRTGDHDRLWTLLRDEDYRRAQVTAFNQYEASYRALQTGIDAYIDRDGETPEDDARLAWLALRASELAEEARSNVQVAFDWAKNRPLNDPARMNDALQRLVVLDEENFYKAALRLLWIEADRQADRPEAERSTKEAQLVLDAVEQRIPTGTGTVDWSRFLSESFMAWLYLYLASSLPALQTEALFARTSETHEYIKCLLQQASRTSNKKVIDRSLCFATKLSDEADDIFSKSKSLSEIAKAHGQSDQTRILNQAIQFAHSIEDNIGLKRAKAFLEVTRAYAQTGRIDEAFHLAQSIKHDQEEFAAAIEIAEALAENDQVDQATALFNKMLRSCRAVEDDYERNRALAEIAGALAQSQQHNQALQVANSIDREYPKQKAFVEIAKALLQINEHKRATSLLDQALQITQFFEGKLDRAKALARIAEALVQSNSQQERTTTLFEESLKAVHSIESNYDRSKVLRDIAKPLAQVQQGEQAKMLSRYTFKVAHSIHHRHFRSRALTGIAGELVQTDQPDHTMLCREQVLQVTHSADEKPDRLQSLTRVAGTLVQVGQPQRATTFLDQILSVIPVSSRDSFKDEAFTEIATAFARSGHHDEALSAVRSMESDFKPGVVADISVALAQAGQYNQALRLARSIIRDYDRCAALVEIAGKFAQEGQHERAYQVARSIDSDYDSAKALANIAQALTQGGHSSRATQLFEQCLQIIRSISHVRRRNDALIEVANSFSKIGKFDKARRLLKEVIENVHSIDAHTVASSILRKVAGALANARQVDHALRIASSISRRHDREEALSEIVGALAQVGPSERALRIAKSIGDESKQVSALAEAASVSIRSNDRTAVEHVLSSVRLSESGWKDLLKRCRASYLRYSSGSSGIRRTLRYYPFSPEIAYDSTYGLYCAHLQDNHNQHAEAIARRCPQLGLDIFLKEERNPANLSPTLHAKYDTYAELWNDGILDKEQFEAKVDALFEQPGTDS